MSTVPGATPVAVITQSEDPPGTARVNPGAPYWVKSMVSDESAGSFDPEGCVVVVPVCEPTKLPPPLFAIA